MTLMFIPFWNSYVPKDLLKIIWAMLHYPFINSQLSHWHRESDMSFQTQESRLSMADNAENAEDAMAHEERPIAQSIGRVLHDLRKQRGLSLHDLSRLSGVSRSMLSQMETGRSIPSVVVLCKIARTFAVPVTVFLKTKEAECPTLSSAKDTPLRVSADGKCAWRSLMATRQERKIEFYEITLQAGCMEKVPSYPPGTKAVLTVSAGCPVVALDGLRYRLNPGDVFEFPASVAHAYTNPGDGKALLYLVLQLVHSF
jgi:transcriptional regulator with XRE-family HTH domain